jgi:LPS-assembly protein
MKFNVVRTFNVTWNHSRDNRARPGTNFSANVNFGSTRFNQNVLNNPFINFNNRLSSSVSYSKDFRGKANMNLNLNHDQNASDRSVRLQLPTIGFNVVTFYPFQKKEKVGKNKWYESIGVGYGGTFNNSIGFYDSAFSIRKMLDTLQWGATHNIPITLALPPIGPFVISPSIGYSEQWFDRVYNRTWNSTTEKIDSSITKTFIRRPSTSFGLNISTRIFGTYLFKNSKNLKAIRHEIRPNIGFAYTPDLISTFLFPLQIDNKGNQVRIDKITGNRVDFVSTAGSITFGIDNLLEMKVKDKTDTTGKKDKKVRLLDVFNIASSYNLAADSFALQPFNIRLGTNLFEKINISAGAVLNPYNTDSAGNLQKTLMWQNDNFSLGRITSGNVAISTQIRSKPLDEKQAKRNTNANDPFMTPDEQQRQIEYARANPAEFTDFNIPWTLSLSYSLNFYKNTQSRLQWIYY